MTKPPKEVFERPSSDHEFLRIKAGASRETKFRKPVGTGRPERLSDRAFLERALARLDGKQAVTAMVIRLDDDSMASPETRDDRPVPVPDLLAALCGEYGGIYGELEDGLFACTVPDKTDRESMEFAESFQRQLIDGKQLSVSVGLATHPTPEYSREQVIENARKALEHAAFFGPGSRVCFDAVSLNISGDQLYQQGDIQGAIDEFNRALVLDPANVNVLNSLGVCHGVNGDYDQAAKAFEDALAEDSGEVMALFNLGMVHLLGKQEPEKALACFLQADELDSQVFEVSLQIGKCYLEAEQPGKARAYLERAVSIKPDAGIAYRFLGQCLQAEDLAGEAVAAFRKAVKLSPKDAESFSALGALLVEQGENPEISVAFCEHSVDLVPDNGLFRYRLGRVLLKQEKTEAALNEFEKARELGYDASEEIEMIRSRMTEGAS